MIKVLFVCMGNICRSPTAEGVFKRLIAEQKLDDAIYIDSAGTDSWHVGQPPDKRAQQAALRRGIDLSTLRARQAQARDLNAFDYVLAMDKDNLAILQSFSTQDNRHKVRLFMEFARQYPQNEVPDPYYGGNNGFDVVLDMIEAACQGLLSEIRAKHLS